MQRDEYSEVNRSEVGEVAFPALVRRGFQVTWEEDPGDPSGDGSAVIYHEDVHEREYWSADEYAAFLAGVTAGMVPRLKVGDDEGAVPQHLLEAAERAGRLLFMLAQQGALSEGGEQPGNAMDCQEAADQIRRALALIQ